jgi:ribosomal protein L37AE/L43A
MYICPKCKSTRILKDAEIEDGIYYCGHCGYWDAWEYFVG